MVEDDTTGAKLVTEEDVGWNSRGSYLGSIVVLIGLHTEKCKELEIVSRCTAKQNSSPQTD